MVNRSDSSDAQRQALSSLVDGELSDREAAEACSGWHGDAQARSDWHTYHLIGDVLRSDDLASTASHDAHFLQSLRLRLSAEPVPLAPAPRLAEPAVADSLPAQQPGLVPPGVARRSRSRHWLMAPAAVAAGFMTVAAVLVVTQSDSAGPAPAATLAKAGTVVPAASATLVRDARLDRYILAHRSLANGAAASGGAEHRVHIVFEGQ